MLPIVNQKSFVAAVIAFLPFFVDEILQATVARANRVWRRDRDAEKGAGGSLAIF